jgi:hypothetical protein
MGLLDPKLPELDLDEWLRGSRNERVRPMVRHFAEVGFGTPDAAILFYILKIGVYLLVGMGFALSTPGIDGFTDVTSWWSEPIVFQKLILWTILFEVLGLGCGFGPLNLRFFPPLGSFLFWLRPGTMRLAPWPGRVPFTQGTHRSVVDVALYAVLLATLLAALIAPGDRSADLPGAAVGVLAWQYVAVVLGILAALGLRDKTIFLAARSEVYGALAVTLLFSGVDAIVAAKLIMATVWFGAALSKVNQHFPFVVEAMMSNSPVWRSKRIKRKFHRNFPDDIRPSSLSAAMAHGGTVVEFSVPLILLFSGGGMVTTIAATIMVLFHLNIISSFPMGVPLEWNVFMIFGILTLFVDKAEYGIGDLTDPILVLAVLAVSLGTVLFGNAFPTKVSFLPAMRYYAGNWDTSLWCLKESALEKFESRVKKSTTLPHVQLEKFYGKEQAEIPLHLGYAFRGLHTHGRALFTLVPRACGDAPEADYMVLDGELIAGTCLGWNFGDGHLHNEQLLAALQERCAFEDGEVRVVMLEAQPIQRQTQQYRIVDAARGVLERGEVRVADLVSRQPWDTDVPLTIHEQPHGTIGA